MGRGKGARTLVVEDALQEILEAQRPMTVRQAYYQLVSRQVVENTRGAYQAMSNILVTLRKEGMIPWAWIEDRMRRPRSLYRNRTSPVRAQFENETPRVRSNWRNSWTRVLAHF